MALDEFLVKNDPCRGKEAPQPWVTWKDVISTHTGFLGSIDGGLSDFCLVIKMSDIVPSNTD